MVEAHVQVPERFASIAPNVKIAFDKFLKTMPELEPLKDIQGGISYKELQTKRSIGGFPVVGHWIAKTPVADILDNYLSSSLYNSRYFGTAFKGWMFLSNTLNQFQLGVGSAFHAGFTSGDVQISAHANIIKDVYGAIRGNRSLADIGRTIAKAPFVMGKTSHEGHGILREWNTPTVNIPANVPVGHLPQGTQHKAGMIAKAVELAGGQFKMDRGLRTTQHNQIIRDWYGGKKITALARSPLAFVEVLAIPMMDWLVPRQKAGVFGEIAGRIIEQNPTKTLEELRPQFRQAWNRTDARLGQVAYNRIFTRNMAKNFIQMMVRAPGWTGGSIAEIGGSVIDTGKFFKEWAQTGKAPTDIPDRVAYTIALLATVMMTNGLLTYAFTGEKPHGMDWWAFRDGNTDKYGKPNRWLVPSYLKDIFAYKQAPVKTISHKTHPALGVITDIAKNRDYYGTEIFNPDDNVLLRQIDKGKYMLKAFVPFWMRGTAKAAESEGGVVKTLKTKPGKLLAPLIGIMPATRAYTMTPFEKVAYESMKSRLPVGSRTKEQAEKSNLKRELERGLRQGDEDARKKIYEAVVQGKITTTDRKAIRKRAKEDPTTRIAKRMPLDDLAKAVAKANDDEKKIIAPIFKKKLDNKWGELDRETKAKYKKIKRELYGYRSKAYKSQPPTTKTEYKPKTLREALNIKGR